MAKTVLIADDEDILRKMLSVKLKSAGYQTREARNGEECLEEVGRERPDMLLLDLMMPRKSGFDVYRALQASEETRDLPVIVLTAREGNRAAEAEELDGVVAYLQKPVSLASLMKLIRDSIGNA